MGTITTDLLDQFCFLVCFQAPQWGWCLPEGLLNCGPGMIDAVSCPLTAGKGILSWGRPMLAKQRMSETLDLKVISSLKTM